MDIYEALYTTRMMRRMRNDSIPVETQNRILDAAIRAPNGGNAQRWHFLMVDDPATKAEIAAIYRHCRQREYEDIAAGALGKTLHDPAEHAATMREIKASGDYFTEHFTEIPLLLFVFSIDDHGGANIYPAIWSALLAARAEGVGGVITTVLRYETDKVTELLGVPTDDGWRMTAMLALGYPLGSWGVAADRRPVHEVSSRNRWGQPWGTTISAPLWDSGRPYDQAGDLAVRMSETSPGQIGVLESTFNTMAGALEASRDKLRLVAEEQTALRRIATLVARGVAPSEVFTAVAAELGHVLGADHTHIVRFEPDNTATVVGYWSDPDFPQIMPPLDGRWPIEDGTASAAVLATARPTRRTDFEGASDAIGVWVRSQKIRCVVGCPVDVEGRVWGAIHLHWMENEPQPGVTEDRMGEFVELVSTAIANAQARSDLLASRSRVVAAADESRRRIERKLHDGAQQRLVALTLKLRMAQTSVSPDQEELKRELSSAVEDLASTLTEVQEISRGIAPPMLRTKGLPPALRSLARRSPVPVQLDVRIGRRPPEPIETAIYYAVSEALANVAKYAHASTVNVCIHMQDTTLRLSIHDDGTGGANLHGGSGLLGLKDRIEALGGRLDIVSPAGDGTTLLIDIPMKHS